MRAPVARATAVVSVVLITAAAGASSALAAPSAGEGTGITLAPAHSTTGSTQTESYFDRTVAAGSSYSDAVRVSNGSSKAVTLDVMPVDGITAASTGADYGQQAATGDGRWITPQSTTITVPAHTTKLEAFRLRVPAGARPGQHLAGLAFVDPTAKSSTRGSLTIRTVYRNVMGVETVVPGPAASRFALRSQSLGAGQGTGLATVTVGLTNIGRLLDKGRLQVTVTGHNYKRTASQQLGLILPGDTVHYVLTWPTAVSAGDYLLTSTFSGGDFPTVTLAATKVHVAAALPGGPNAPIRPFSTQVQGEKVQQSPATTRQRPMTLRPHHSPRNVALIVSGAVAGGLVLVLALLMAFFAGRRPRQSEQATDSDAKQLINA